MMSIITVAKAQTAMQFSGLDCSGNAVDLFADLDAGKAVILHFYMPSCGSCPPPAQKIQAMANHINAAHPGSVKGYAFPYQNTTACSYSSTWVTSNSLSALYAPMDSGAAQVAYYGGFGMPTVVLLGGLDHRTMFKTLSFNTSDTTKMRDSILTMLGFPPSTAAINEPNQPLPEFNVFPNPSNDQVSINYNLKESSDLQISINDINGKQVAFISGENESGSITKQFSTAKLPDGNYFIRLIVNGKTSTQNLTIAH